MVEKVSGIVIGLLIIIASIVLMVVFRTNSNYLAIFIPCMVGIVLGGGLLIKAIKE